MTVIVTEDAAHVPGVVANGSYLAGLPSGGATFRSATLWKVYKEIERDRLERCWRRDADKVYSLR